MQEGRKNTVFSLNFSVFLVKLSYLKPVQEGPRKVTTFWLHFGEPLAVFDQSSYLKPVQEGLRKLVTFGQWHIWDTLGLRLVPNSGSRKVEASCTGLR